jgi:hypothetical protein
MEYGRATLRPCGVRSNLLQHSSFGSATSYSIQWNTGEPPFAPVVFDPIYFNFRVLPMKTISTLTEAKQYTRTGWLAALLVAGITLAVSIAGMAGFKFLNFGAWTLIDVGLSLGLAYGISRYSRASAVIMLIYYAIGQILVMVQLQKPPNLVSLVFILCFFQGIRGTFAYHRLNQPKKQPLEQTSEPVDRSTT